MLADRYRPTAWADVVGQERAVAALVRLAGADGRGLLGRAIWIAGASGTGKTTLARLAAQEVADPHNITELDAGEATPGTIGEMLDAARLYPMGKKPGRAYIINEAHGLRRDAIRRLLVALEPIPKTSLWIFTTTNAGQEALFEDNIDAGPLLSRCLQIPLARQGLAQAFAERAQAIARAEGLDGRPIAQYVRLLQDCRNNLRMALSRIEAGEMMGA